MANRTNGRTFPGRTDSSSPGGWTASLRSRCPFPWTRRCPSTALGAGTGVPLGGERRISKGIPTISCRTDGTFTLTQSGREIKYRSEPSYSEDGLSTTIVNRIANTIDYDIEKVWKDANGNPTEAPEGAEVTFVIYQTLSGESLDEDKIVAEVTMDGQADDNKIVVNEKLGLTFQETETAAGKVRLKIF